MFSTYAAAAADPAAAADTDPLLLLKLFVRPPGSKLGDPSDPIKFRLFKGFLDEKTYS